MRVSYSCLLMRLTLTDLHIAISEALVKKALAEEDSVFLKSGGSFPHKTTAAQFVSIALDLEEAQYVLILTVLFF